MPTKDQEPDQSDAENPEDLEALQEVIADALRDGQPRSALTKKLIDEGWDQAKAIEFVTTIDERVGPRAGGHRRRSGGGGGGWLVWIGILALVNLLSYLLDWSFWIY